MPSSSSRGSANAPREGSSMAFPLGAIEMTVLVQAEQRQREAGGAEPASRSARLDERPLHRTQRAGSSLEAFDRDQRLAVDDGQQPDAGVDGSPAQVTGAGALGDHHRAGAAIG